MMSGGTWRLSDYVLMQDFQWDMTHIPLSPTTRKRGTTFNEPDQSLVDALAAFRAKVIETYPQRTQSDGPNIVQFALSTNHAPGTQMYKRSSLRLTDPGAACAKFASPDLAQQAFLASGGPERDRKGLDPDGDGFACGWDPRPFRAVR